MQTIIQRIDEKNMDLQAIQKGAKLLQDGCLVVFPTETVYGLGANGRDALAVEKIFTAKGRPADNPLILHVATMEEAERCGVMTKEAIALCGAFWPGPLTVIVKKRSGIARNVSAGLDTVAIRMPAHPIARALLAQANLPIAAPSANISGRPSPTCPEHVICDLQGRVDMIIDGGKCEVGIESTVIDLTEAVPTILRPGGITLEQLRIILPHVQTERLALGAKPKSPGMKYRHYAPKAKVVLFDGEDVEKKLQDALFLAIEHGEKIGIFAPHAHAYKGYHEAVEWMDAEHMASILFSTLREMDTKKIDTIFCIVPGEGGIATGVRNRLYKAAGKG